MSNKENAMSFGGISMGNELEFFAEKRASEAENIGAFQGVKLLYIRKQVEDMLALIGRNGFFDQYTRHDISHIDGMLEIVDWVIPDITKEYMSKADWLMLVLAIYFHDMGMLVTAEEYENRDTDEKFVQYKNKALAGEFGNEYRDSVLDVKPDYEHFLYQEYVRYYHAERIKRWITNMQYDNAPEECQSITNSITQILTGLDSKFRRDLGLICESHHLNDLDNFSKYSTCARYGNSNDECVNLQYIAIILRTADIFHITCERTPSVQFCVINPTNAKSIIEWQKQMAVKAVTPKTPRNSDGNIDSSIPKDTVEITAYFDQPDQAEAFFGLSAYVMYMRDELKRNYDWVLLAEKKEGTSNYKYPWKHIDDDNIETFGFEPHKLQFTVDQTSILQMLVGHTLYNDSSVVIRELIQNGIDAVKLQYCIDTCKDIPEYIPTGEVKVLWDESCRTLIVMDNGTGMTIQEVENFLLRVGASKYRSENFQKQFPDFPAISRFGIGVLTCFLIADDIDITTCSTEEDAANIISLRKVNGKYLLKKSSKSDVQQHISQHGTEIVLHVRSDVDIEDILSAIRKWVIFPQCKVTLHTNGKDISVGYKSPKEALTEYLNSGQYIVDNRVYRVDEICEEGVTLAYALHYNEYLNEWTFLSSEHFESDTPSLIGTCIEGIRVEFSTPGYNGETIIAVANTHNCSAVLTNVARSAIEENDSKENFLRILYACYKKHILSQMNILQKDRSLDWSIAECRYLMDPLLAPAQNGVVLQSQEAFFQIFDQLNSIVIEESGERKAVSVETVKALERICIVDSAMVSTATMLLREVRSKSTLSDLIHTLEQDIDILPDVPIICGYDFKNILHRRAFQKKQASSIVVSKQHRRVDIVFTHDVQNWESFSTHVGRVHVPLGSVDIMGLSNEFGVYTIDGIYLSYKDGFTQYLKELLKKFDYVNLSKDRQLVSALLSISCDERLLDLGPVEQRQYNTDYLFRRAIEEFGPYSNLLWERIDRDDFVSNLFREKHILYRPRDWSRHINKSNRSRYVEDMASYY
jgi:molecular chaperone HtpG